MTDYLVTHEWLSELAVVATFILLTLVTLGTVMFSRRRLHGVPAVLAAIVLAATLPYQFSIKEEQNQRHVREVEEQEISLAEYRHFRAWIAGVPHPPDLTDVLADGRVSRAEYSNSIHNWTAHRCT